MSTQSKYSHGIGKTRCFRDAKCSIKTLIPEPNEFNMYNVAFPTYLIILTSLGTINQGVFCQLHCSTKHSHAALFFSKRRNWKPKRDARMVSRVYGTELLDSK